METSQDNVRVRIYADLEISLDTALRIHCAGARISRKKFIEDAVVSALSRVTDATARDSKSRRQSKKG